MFHFLIGIKLLHIPIEIIEPQSYIIPGDDLVIALEKRLHLYISMEEGLLVMNNDFYHKESIDYPIPISIKRIDYKFHNDPVVYYEILVDGYTICSFGYLQNVGECDMMEHGESKWLLKGTDASFMIEGRGGCMTVFKPGEWSESYKHGVRIESCDNKPNQKFTIKRCLI